MIHDDLALELLAKAGSLFGRHLRELLAQKGHKLNNATFSTMMARLEKTGQVEGWYENRKADDMLFQERKYRLKAKKEGDHA